MAFPAIAAQPAEERQHMPLKVGRFLDCGCRKAAIHWRQSFLSPSLHGGEQ
jgi:hypothetical protein